MRRIIKTIVLIAVLRWGINSTGSFSLELPSGRRLLDCLAEITEAVTDLFQEIKLVPKDQNSESCLYFSGRVRI